MFKKHERFDYTPDDCYELAESIRKYVVPLIDKIFNEKNLNFKWIVFVHGI